MKSYKTMSVGEIVADNFEYAKIFDKYGIDFCCNGAVPLTKACENAGAKIDAVVAELADTTAEVSETIDFKTWPTDLLLDYILKFHHRNIRTQGPSIAGLLNKVCGAHGNAHPELFRIKQLFEESLFDLENHLQKEEQILFPYIYEQYAATAEGRKAGAFHCGTVEGPISVMMAEHDAEGERYREISRLTNGYTMPEDACGSYRLLLEKLKSFESALHHHIHLENNIVFPRAMIMEAQNR